MFSLRDSLPTAIRDTAFGPLPRSVYTWHIKLRMNSFTFKIPLPLTSEPYNIIIVQKGKDN